MKISLIICLYNTKREYFEQCLRTLTESTLAKGGYTNGIDYEICVIDDGSELDYSDLVEKYSLSYYKTENRGIFAARLYGISMARGEYIAFADSDDTVTVNYHRPMLEEAERSGADIVFNDWAFHTERTRYFCSRDTTLSGEPRDGDAILLSFSQQRGREHSYFVLWNKLYKRELMLRVRDELSEMIRGEERFNFSEDALMNFYAFKWAQKLRFVHTGYYFYRIHGNQSVTVTGEDKLRRQIECMTYTLDRMERDTVDNAYADRIGENLRAWRQLMSRTHYSYAKMGKHTALYGFIRDRYGVSKLRRSTIRDGSVYGHNRLVGDNLPDIDRILFRIWRTEGELKITDGITSAYAKRTLDYFKESGLPVELCRDGKFTLPDEVKGLKNRIILNPLVYRVGMLLFPKGSKLRALLKKKI